MTVRSHSVNTTIVRPLASAGIDAVLAAATREVVMVRGLPEGGGDPVRVLRQVDHHNLRRGVRYRVLLPAGAGPAPVVPVGARLRTLPVVPAELTVVDGALALVPGGRRPGLPADLAMSRLPGVVGAVAALFEQLWTSAAPLTGGDADGAPDDRERELLALLGAGFTDESAAARLGVSVRTVRRMMSTVMARLGARSRFQAGLKVAGRSASMATDTVCACAGDCHGRRPESAPGRRRIVAGSGVCG